MTRIQGPRLFVLAVLGASLASCAGSKQDIDLTPASVDAHVGKGWSSDSTRVEDISDKFGIDETVYAVVDVPSKTKGTIRVRWVYNGAETLREQTMTMQEQANVYPFQLAPPAGGHKVGAYVFEVYIDDDRVESEKFEVEG